MDYSYYSYGSSASNLATTSSIVDTLFTILLTYSIIVLVIAVLQIVALWKIFTKAGEKGWKAIIPIYNLVTLFKISGLSPWIIFGYLATFIPFVGWIVCLGISIYQCNSLAKAFGKDVGYTIGLLLVPTIFYMILGFGNAQYVGPGNVTTSSTTYQGDGVVNISEKTKDESTTNNDEDNANL